MELSRLGQGQQIAGVAGIALFIFMFLPWFGPSLGGDVGGDTLNAWQSFDLIDIVLLLAIVTAVAAAVLAASDSPGGLPVAASSLVALFGGIATVLILYRVISPIGVQAPGLGTIDFDRKIGLYLGLIAAAFIAYGGWRGMQEDGTSLGGEYERATRR